MIMADSSLSHKKSAQTKALPHFYIRRFIFDIGYSAFFTDRSLILPAL